LNLATDEGDKKERLEILEELQTYALESLHHADSNIFLELWLLDRFGTQAEQAFNKVRETPKLLETDNGETEGQTPADVDTFMMNTVSGGTNGARSQAEDTEVGDENKLYEGMRGGENLGEIAI
jgi:hypothetical protein